MSRRQSEYPRRELHPSVKDILVDATDEPPQKAKWSYIATLFQRGIDPDLVSLFIEIRSGLREEKKEINKELKQLSSKLNNSYRFSKISPLELDEILTGQVNFKRERLELLQKAFTVAILVGDSHFLEDIAFINEALANDPELAVQVDMYSHYSIAISLLRIQKQQVTTSEVRKILEKRGHPQDTDTVRNTLKRHFKALR